MRSKIGGSLELLELKLMTLVVSHNTTRKCEVRSEKGGRL